MNTQNQTRSRAAFTLLELLVIIVTLVVLAAMVLPALAGTRSNTKAAQCMSNLRRLTGAWQMYTSDNADRFPFKIVSNGVDWGATPDNTNTAKFMDTLQSPIARYMQSPDLFKCPADNYLSPLQQASGFSQRILSVSGNAVLGNGVQPNNVFNEIPGRNYTRQLSKFTQLNKPGPANTVTLLDEHPDSIDDALFITRVGCSTGNAFWANRPGTLHDGDGTISFADGHVILKRWQDIRTQKSITFNNPQIDGIDKNIFVSGSTDYAWMNDHMPYQ